MVKCDHEDFVQARKQMQFGLHLRAFRFSEKSLESAKTLVGYLAKSIFPQTQLDLFLT
jgi:hypothetical protein